MNKFRTSIPTGNKTGRPSDSTMKQNFQKILVGRKIVDSELYTLKKAHQKMLEYSGEFPCFGTRYMKRKLFDFYGDHIYFSERNGRSDMLCFKDL